MDPFFYHKFSWIEATEGDLLPPGTTYQIGLAYATLEASTYIHMYTCNLDKDELTIFIWLLLFKHNVD
jgi:hypothetical protein